MRTFGVEAWSGTMGSSARTSHLVTRLLVSIITVCVHVEAQNVNFSYASFSTPESFLMVEDVLYYPDNYSFLMNARSAALLEESGSCGRLLYKDKVRMKHPTSNAVASFNTAFTFKISGPDLYEYPDFGVVHADGLAFTFTRNDSLLGQDSGSSLCLIKESDNGLPSNRLFAVEFDTFYNYWFNDPSDSHVGVDVNSMNSTESYNLCGGEVKNCSYLCNGGYFTAWVDYDSASQKLEIFFANGSLFNNVAKPRNPLLNATLSLSELLDDFMYVGFSSSTGLFSEVHVIQSWSFASSGMPELAAAPSPGGVNLAVPTSDNSSSKVGIIAGVAAGAVAALLLVGFFIAMCRRRTSTKKGDKFNLVDQNLVPRAFTYKELCKATKSFSRSELLGSGGFGAVYRGTLPSGAVVAVKRLRHESKKGEESFQAEAASLSQIRHRNLVQLRGWCSEEEQLFLVYDYMCNGSLDEWLFRFSAKGMPSLKDADSLPLALRHSVLSGVATALAYLHEECAQCVLHRDIKSSNVLLDGDLNAYLGDFGLARLIDHRKMEKTTMMAGTLGYMAPEMPHTGKATKETDVYSFGVLTLEVLCGARPLDMAFIERGDGVLVDRVWRAHEAGNIIQVADPSIATFALSGTSISLSRSEFESQEVTRIPSPDAANEEKKLITSLLRLGLLCCNPNPEGRPSMRMVSQLMLQSSDHMETATPPLPSSKPESPYTRPGFSEVDMRALYTSSTSSGVVNVRDAARGPSDSTPPSSGFSSNAGPGTTLQASFVASSDVFSGR